VKEGAAGCSATPAARVPCLSQARTRATVAQDTAAVNRRGRPRIAPAAPGEPNSPRGAHIRPYNTSMGKRGPKLTVARGASPGGTNCPDPGWQRFAYSRLKCPDIAGPPRQKPCSAPSALHGPGPRCLGR
jgi:hypothetical protein